MSIAQRNCALRVVQPEEQISRRRCDGDTVRAVAGRDAVTAGCPTAAGEGTILLQRVTARICPRHDDAVAGMRDDEVGQACRLHHLNQRPETARDGIIAAAHRAAGVRLADGSADGELPVGARAAAAGDFRPVNGIRLPECPKTEGGMKNDETNRRQREGLRFHKF